MGNGSGVSRGDRNRNARLARLRGLVRPEYAIVGIDLADRKQMVVVTDHDSKVLARRTFRCVAWELGVALDWAAEHAALAGFGGVTVACEPTGHRWRVLGQLAADRGMPFVCVQPALSSWARRTEDLTTDKTDEKDAVLIARLTAQLRCYAPEPVDETWGRLRHLGARRERLLAEHVACVQQIRDLLECVWPAALTAAGHPFKSVTWVAGLAVVMGRDGGDLARTHRLGPARFERAVRTEILRRGRKRPCRRIARALYAPQAKLADTETRMTAVLDELGLTTLVTSIPGLSPVGAAAILAQTGDLRRFTSARAVVKHAGLAPPRTHLRHVHRTGPPDRRRTPRPTRRSLAGRVGMPAHQPRVRRPIPAPHHPRPQQADRDPGPDRHRRRPAAPALRRRRLRPAVGPRDRHPRHPAGSRGGGRRVDRRPRASAQPSTRHQPGTGASPPRH